jgi:hypothetical protein
MSLWVPGIIIAGAGWAGGLVNALLTDNGFHLPSYVHAESARVLRPGFASNLVIGATAAFVTWGLSGRWAGASIAGIAANSNPAKFLSSAPDPTPPQKRSRRFSRAKLMLNSRTVSTPSKTLGSGPGEGLGLRGALSVRGLASSWL